MPTRRGRVYGIGGVVGSKQTIITAWSANLGSQFGLRGDVLQIETKGETKRETPSLIGGGGAVVTHAFFCLRLQLRLLALHREPGVRADFPAPARAPERAAAARYPEIPYHRTASSVRAVAARQKDSAFAPPAVHR